jgi:hypothetical protein
MYFGKSAIIACVSFLHFPQLDSMPVDFRSVMEEISQGAVYSPPGAPTDWV